MPIPELHDIEKRYIIEHKLGSGGIGVVYLAKDFFDSSNPSLCRKVAIKILKSGAEGYLRRKFDQEKEALSRIRHPYVVEVLDAGELDDQTPWFAMQYVEGLSLRDGMALFSKHNEGLDFSLVGRWMRQLGQAISSAHSVGVLHRDLKPENVMLQKVGDSEFQVKIIDFGIAKVHDSLLEGNISNTVSGTASYMSPEQIAGRSSEASDIYTLGVIAYELLTGVVPFQVSSESLAARLFEIAERQRQGKFTPPERLRLDLPASVNDLICRALDFDPARRPVSAIFFGEELERLLLGKAPEVQVDPEAPTVVNLQTPPSNEVVELIEPGGALGLGSQLYIVRETDHELIEAVHRGDSIVLIKGARQMGKTSLLARGLREARSGRVKVVLTDFQKLSAEDLVSSDSFFREMAAILIDTLGLDGDPTTNWNPRRGPTINFERFLRREILEKLDTPLVWGIDEADRLFGCAFASEVFGLFRSWHNERALDPDSPWNRLTLLISYATEAHLFITDMNQSPFNVGTRITMDDFTEEHIRELNRRYGEPFPSPESLNRFYALIGGQPYLSQKGLYELARHSYTPDTLLERADAEDGPFGEHLRRLSLSIRQESILVEAIRTVIRGEGSLSSDVFYRLRSSGVLIGDSSTRATLRCELYRRFLQKQI